MTVLAGRMNTEKAAFSALTRLLRSHAVFEVFRQHHVSLLESVYSSPLQSENASFQTSGGSAMHSADPTQLSAGILHILPSSIGVPSSYISYLELLIRGDQTETLGQWQDRLYEFLSRAPLELLSSLSESVVHLCVQRWAALMRSPNCAESLCAAYVCCKLRRHAEGLRRSDSSMGSYPPVCATLRAWIEKCHAIFEGAQSIETVRSTLIRVLKLTCDEKSRGLANADTAVALAGEVLTTSQRPYTGDWTKDTGPYARKIAQKYDGMSPELRVASIHVLAVLEPRAWFSEGADIFRKALQHVTSTATALRTSQHPHSRNAEMLLYAAERCMALTSMDQSTHIFASFVKDLYGFIIEQCRPHRMTTTDNLAGLEQALLFIEALQAIERRDPPMVASMFLQAVTAMGVPDWWALDMMTPGTPENCCSLPSCVHSDEIKRQRLCNLVSLLLITSGCGDGRKLPRSTAEALGQRLAEGCPGDDQKSCSYRPFVPSRQIQEAKQLPDLNSHNWHDYLEDHLRSSKSVSYELTEALISTVCKDLQDRCDNVEVPLRAAQANVQHLTDLIQLLENKAAAAASEIFKLQEDLRLEQEATTCESSYALELKSSLAAQQQQLQEAQQQIDAMVSEKDKSDQRFKQLLDDTQQKADEDMDTLQHQHATHVSELEAQLSSQTHANSALESESAWLKEQTDLARKELVATHMREIEELKQQHEGAVGQLQRQITELQDAASLSSSEVDRLTSDLCERDRSIEEIVQHRDESHNQISTLNTDLQKANADISTLTTKLAEAHATNKALSDQASSNAAELTHKEERITELVAIEGRWKQRGSALEKALADARQREEGISALLGGRTAVSSGQLPSRRSTLAAVRNPSQQQVGSRQSLGLINTNQTTAAAPRLPAGSFMSDDDDENYYEIMKLAQ